MRSRLVVLVSGAGTNLQALLDACADEQFGAQIVAVGADRSGIAGLERAEAAGIGTFVHRVKDYPDRAAWDAASTESCRAHQPDLVVLAGFMKLVGHRPGHVRWPLRQHLPRAATVVSRHARGQGRPGLRGEGDRVHRAHRGRGGGCRASGGPGGVPVHDDDDEASLHERIKVTERALLVADRGPDGSRGMVCFRQEGEDRQLSAIEIRRALVSVYDKAGPG